ncbi:MAG: radical SAM protein, partial [Gemmatimonadetes bacterium]|nr:radical SAM protein [Gemmatimonadota bacterium]
MPSVVIRVTERCNAYCRYCTFSRKPRGATMDLGVVDLLLRQVDDYLCANTDKTMELLWHGGEPLLPGLRFYQRVIQLQRERCRGTHGRIVHRVQTNLTCLSDRLLPVLQELGVTELGTSFDPEPGVRGLGPSVDTAKYLERFFRALRLVEAAELRWGVLYVVTGRSRSEPEGVFLLLTNLQPEGRISFIPVMDTPAEAADLRLSPEEFAHFLGSFLPHWWRRRDRFPAVEPFQGCLSAAARDGSEA